MTDDKNEIEGDVNGIQEYSLEELEKDIAGYKNNTNKLPRSKHIVVKLPSNIKQIDMCVLSNIMLGLTGAHHKTAKEDKPFRIQKFKAHIEELARNPEAQVMLGGDLFYFPGGGIKYRKHFTPSYNDQVNLMAKMLAPIKDKIIGAYDGTEEIKIFEKDGINLTYSLMRALGISDRYCGQMAEVDFIFNNDMTNNTAQPVHMLFDHGFLVANVTATVAKKTEGLQDKINGKDFYFTSHYNKLFIERRAALVVDKGNRMLKKPYYFVSVGGYRDYPNRLTSNRNVSAANTDNGMIRVFVVPNPDRGNVRGHDYVGEPTYKICQEFKNFGRTPGTELDFNIMREIAKINAENTYAKIMLQESIDSQFEKLQSENVDKILAKYYEKQEQSERAIPSELKKIVKNESQPLIISEEEDDL